MAVSETPAAPNSGLTVMQRKNGKWAFGLKVKGVAYPLQGHYENRAQAEVVGFATLSALMKPKG